MKKDAKLTSDEQLMREVAAGSREAKRTLLTMLYRRVHSRVRFLCRNDAEAEDITQDTLLQVLESASSFRADGCIEAWADVITVRTVAKRMTRIRRMRWLLGGAFFEPPSKTGTPEQSMSQRSRSERINKLLGKLPTEWREVLILKLMYGYSAKEVAEMTDQSLKQVQYFIKRGRDELRRLVLKDAQLRELFPEVAL